MRRNGVAILLWICVLAAVTVSATTGETTRHLRQQKDTEVEPDDNNEQEAEDTPPAVIDDGSHVWEPVATPTTTTNVTTNAPSTTPTTMPPTTKSPTSSSGSSFHQAQLDLQEKSASGNAPPAGTAASTATAPAHHSTPMMGFVVVGAMAILCVGVAAGVAKRKKDSNHHDSDAPI